MYIQTMLSTPMNQDLLEAILSMCVCVAPDKCCLWRELNFLVKMSSFVIH